MATYGRRIRILNALFSRRYRFPYVAKDTWQGKSATMIHKLTGTRGNGYGVQQRKGRAVATLSLTYPVMPWPLGGRRCQSPR